MKIILKVALCVCFWLVAITSVFSQQIKSNCYHDKWDRELGVPDLYLSEENCMTLKLINFSETELNDMKKYAGFYSNNTIRIQLSSDMKELIFIMTDNGSMRKPNKESLLDRIEKISKKL